MNHLLLYLEHFRASDLVDIFIITVVVYRFLLIVQGTRALQMLSGLGFIFGFYWISVRYEFYALNWLLSHFFDYFFLILIILFQDSIRAALVSFGLPRFFSRHRSTKSIQYIEEVVEACGVLSRERTGAIIVFEKNNGLLNYAQTGTILDCKVNSDMIYSIFQHNSPLHDGAIIIYNQRIQAAGCFLPLSKNVEIDRHYGTRHRAALGITEVSDAVVLVVSEETGAMMLCYSGAFIDIKSEDDLRRKIRKFIFEDDRELQFEEMKTRRI